MVGKRQLVVDVTDMNATDNLRLTMHGRITRYIDPKDLKTRQGSHEILDQKALCAAEVEHAIAGFQVPMRDHVLRDRQPSPVVSISSVAIFARPIEIFKAVLSRNAD